MKTRGKNIKRGFTLIEITIGLLIVTMVTIGVYNMLNYALRLIREKGWREQALTIANEEMEYFRSISYDTLGTAATNCAPTACSLAPVKTVTRNNRNYTVLTDVRHIDDVFDNTPQTEVGTDDTGLNDYKKARVEVQWPSSFDNNSIILVSTFAPVGIETDCGGGILKVTVFDANAQLVPQASVRIKNDNLVPAYEYDTKTNDQGVLRIGCLLEDLSNNYELTINHPDSTYYNNIYSTAQTCPTGTGTSDPICPKSSPSNVNPNDPHLNIITGNTTEKSLAIDLLSTLNVQTITQNLPAEWNVNENTGDGKNQDMPAVGIGLNDNYYFFWRDDKQGPTRIYGQKYDSSQIALWGNDVQISTSNNQILPNVVVSQTTGDAYLGWNHDNGGNQDSYLERLASADGSSVWGGNQRLLVDSTNQNNDQTNIKIHLEDNEQFLYATFQDNSNDNNDIYVTRLNTADASQLYCDEDNTVCASEGVACGTAGLCTKWSGETKINDDIGTNTQALQNALVESITDDLYTVWHDDRSGNYDIYAQKINPDGGFDTTWNANIQINETSNQEQSYPAMAISNEGGNNYIYIVWQDFRNSNDYDIYLAKYDTNGNRIFADVDLTTKDLNNKDQTRPTIAINASNEIYIAWVDERNGNQDIYLQKFNTTGVAQWTNDLRINDDQTSGSTQTSPQLKITGSGGAIIVWQDNDAGDEDIRAATFSNPNPTSEGTVPLRIYGTKIIGKDTDDNDIYKFDNTFTTNAGGDLKFDGNDQSKLEWDTYNFDINGATYNLLRTEPIDPITINPNTINNIILIVESVE